MFVVSVMDGRVRKPALLNRPGPIQRNQTDPDVFEGSQPLAQCPKLQRSVVRCNKSKPSRKSGRSVSNDFVSGIARSSVLAQGDVSILAPAGESETMVVMGDLHAIC